MKNFADRLIDAIEKKKSPVVAGLDPKLEYVPESLRGSTAAGSIFNFNKELIDSLYDVVPAVKPQLAYYEMYGVEGIEAFKKTVDYAKSKGLLVIADGKRNDIGSTCEAYSTAFLKDSVFDADALTVNAYLGIDGVQPFLEDCKKYGKGIFILVKTSNKSSGQLQDLMLAGGKTVYETMAALVNEWGRDLIGERGYSAVGAVVGATYPVQAAGLRKIMDKAIFLVPGYGAQGGTALDAAPNFDPDGLGAVVNASRSIMCAYKSEKWNKYSVGEAARAEALDMAEALNKCV
ncbi:MAG: orotidine-5'-phosphate decarboxylase [Clostridiales bacterium]|jgi:orotidine-5'-phosphate decarboxylase|nr:orotidine-5'-phosphate decarboxylase [Clostridiales bacterium]